MTEDQDGISIIPLAVADFPEVKTIEILGQKIPWSDDSLLSELSNAAAFHFGIRIMPSRFLTAFILSRIVLDEMHIHHVCTHPGFRRSGFARKLLDRALETARSRGIKKAFLEVAAPNIPAVALYKKAGFALDFIREKYYSSGDDAIVMSKRIIKECQ
jgi:[ribosomal protein S18]-alanine N-acetyltransferase